MTSTPSPERSERVREITAVLYEFDPMRLRNYDTSLFNVPHDEYWPEAEDIATLEDRGELSAVTVKGVFDFWFAPSMPFRTANDPLLLELVEAVHSSRNL